jgi:hypothetical protein
MILITMEEIAKKLIGLDVRRGNEDLMILAFCDYEFEGVSEVAISRGIFYDTNGKYKYHYEVYINHDDAPRIKVKVKDNIIIKAVVTRT